MIYTNIGSGEISLFQGVDNKKSDTKAYYYKNIDVNMVVNENNSYDIVETADVFFKEERHGLIWKVPAKTYTNRFAKIDKGRVEGHKYTISRNAFEYDIKIGDADKYVTGDQQYVISYTYNLGFDALNKMDELYYNLVGLGHDVDIENITFTITMPKSFDSSKLNFTYGKFGDTDSSDVKYSVSGNIIKGTLKGGLGPNEALTVALPLPEGYFKNVWRDTSLMALMGDYYEFAYLLFLIIAIIIWGIFCKNDIIFPTVEFYAPNNYNPTEIGFINDGEIDPYDITALIIYWANNGKLMIQEEIETVKNLFGSKEKSTLTFIKNEELDSGSRPYEKKLFNAMFNKCGNGNRVTVDELKGKFGFYISTESIKQSMQKNKETRIFSSKGKTGSFLIKGICLLNAFWFSTVLGYGLYHKSNEELIIGLLFSLAICIPLWIFSKFLTRWKNIMPRLRFNKLFNRLIFLAISFAIFYYIAYKFSFPFMYLSGYIVCFLISLLSAFSMKRTPYGDRQTEKVIGFKEFIESAEKDKINMLVEENPEYFFYVLPYAMALGITDKWAKKFEGIVTAAPSWYSTNALNNRTFDMYQFTNSFNNNTNILANTIAASMAVASAASSGSSSSSSGGWGGSSDGGSAGGGSGGSGSSDW